MKTIYSSIFEIIELIRCTLGNDPNIKVGRGCKVDCYTIELPIYVKGENRAENLRNIVPYEYCYGTQKLCVKIYTECKEEILGSLLKCSTRGIASSFCQALSTNCFFVGTMLGPEQWVALTNEVYVFLEQPCGSFDVCEAFAIVLKSQFGILFTTQICYKIYDPFCIKSSQFYCGKQGCY